MPITHSKITSRAPITHTPGPSHAQGRYIPEVNARMMAAAPDMVELLYRCLPFIEDANQDPCYKPDRVAALENQIRTLLDSLERPL